MVREIMSCLQEQGLADKNRRRQRFVSTDQQRRIPGNVCIRLQTVGKTVLAFQSDNSDGLASFVLSYVFQQIFDRGRDGGIRRVVVNRVGC